jgi:hypothetical protein
MPLCGELRNRDTKADGQKFQRDVTEGKTAADVPGARKRGRIRVSGGADTAWRATAVLSAMLGWAVSRRLRADNPAEGVQLNKLAARERFLTDAEVTRLGEAMAGRESILPLLQLSGCCC